MKKLSEEERDILQELVRESDNVERTCKNLGIEYTDEMLINWINNTAHYRINVKPTSATQFTSPSNTLDPTVKKMEQIVKGDNLDMVEEAAKDRGLI
jgi:diketogulonate reductase-like aldo/keto reductase